MPGLSSLLLRLWEVWRGVGPPAEVSGEVDFMGSLLSSWTILVMVSIWDKVWMGHGEAENLRQGYNCKCSRCCWKVFHEVWLLLVAEV